MYPDRIDIGIGGLVRNEVWNRLYCLCNDRRQRRLMIFETTCRNCLSYFNNDASWNGPLPSITRSCRLRRVRNLSTGSSPQSAMWAAELGRSYGR